jgi:hypothetical protein
MALTTGKNLLANPVQVTVRLDGELHRELQDSAKCELRSVNAQINHLLRASLEREAAAT